MARKRPVNRAIPMMIEESKHDRMLSEMHDALYSLGDKIRKPMARPGDKLLPDHLKKSPPRHGAMAKKHIERLHKEMRESEMEEDD